MRIFHTDQFPLPLPPGHRFPESKYRLLREAVAASSRVDGHELVVPEAADDRQLLRVHAGHYIDSVVHGPVPEGAWRPIGLPWSPELVERCRRSVGGTIAAAASAVTDGVSIHLAGGTHHAFRERGGGYCVFNDVAVAIRALQAERRIERAAVIDADVHQGNGTAAIFAEDRAVFTFSIHGARNYPFRKERSDLDIPLADGSGDASFLLAFEPAVRAVLLQSRPDLVIYIAGADPWEGDRLGRLALTPEGLWQRDRIVRDAAAAQRIPVCVVMGGGYAPDPRDTARLHLGTVESFCAAD